MLAATPGKSLISGAIGNIEICSEFLTLKWLTNGTVEAALRLSK
jgi:hypothetical protein